MRLIWTTDNADQFRTFCHYLHSQNIHFTSEEQSNRNWDSEQYGLRKYLLWITDENDVEFSTRALVRFLDNPSSDEFSSKARIEIATDTSLMTQFLEEKLHQSIERKDEIEIKKEFSGHIKITAIIILIASCLFLFDLYTTQNTKFERAGSSSVKKALLFDYPRAEELADKIVALYGLDNFKKPQELPAPGQFLLQEALKTPAFPGFYPYIVAKTREELGSEKTNLTPLTDIKLFEKEREGEIWRLFSPTLLHNDILHLFFNMVWLLLLGTQIEARLSASRYLLFLITAGIVSNSAQYLMTGPNFIGFSGIICAMATYIWQRQRVAPWEAYQMSSGTFVFICFFVGLLAALSLLAFALEVFQNSKFPISIANTAHLVGAIMGYFMGRMRFFAWQLRN